MVKIVDVALEAKVSVATVSRALNGHPTVDPRLAARVRAAADKLGYRPNSLARNLRRQRTNLWLLIISDIENPFFTSIARGVEDIAVDNRFSVVLCNADEDAAKESGYIDLAVAEQAAGVVISPHSDATDIAPLLESSIPTVVIDRQLAAAVDTITTDSRGGAKAATEHLLAEGWKRPACVTGPRTAETAMERRRGYREAVRAAGLPAVVAHEPFTTDGGRAASSALLDRDPVPDALFAANAALGLGVLHELRGRGLRPGSDIGLICFDDAPWAPFIDPPISVVSQPAYRMGSEAAERLVARRAETTQSPPYRRVLGTDLIVRESSRRRQRTMSRIIATSGDDP